MGMLSKQLKISHGKRSKTPIHSIRRLNNLIITISNDIKVWKDEKLIQEIKGTEKSGFGCSAISCDGKTYVVGGLGLIYYYRIQDSKKSVDSKYQDIIDSIDNTKDNTRDTNREVLKLYKKVKFGSIDISTLEFCNNLLIATNLD